MTHSDLKVYLLMPVRADYSCPRSLDRLYSKSKSEPQTENRFLLCQAKASTVRAISEWQFIKINYILWARGGKKKSEYLNSQGWGIASWFISFHFRKLLSFCQAGMCAASFVPSKNFQRVQNINERSQKYSLLALNLQSKEAANHRGWSLAQQKSLKQLLQRMF